MQAAQKERQKELPREMPAGVCSPSSGCTRSDPRASPAGSQQTRSEGWHCQGRCKTEERHSRQLAGREERVLKRQIRYTRSGSIPMLNGTPREAKRAQVRWGPGAAGASRDLVPAETQRTRHTRDTSSKGYKE